MDEGISRRQFVGIGVGFALAVRPISAWAILTSGDGLVEGPVQISNGAEKIPAYRAMPKGKGPFPIVLVTHEIFGVHEYIQDVCRRFAKLGYLAVAPNLFFRQGDATKVADIKKLISDIVSKASQPQVMSDLDATLAWASSNHGDSNRAVLTGFCWGGRVTWLYAAHNPKLKAAVAWYGPLVGSPSSTQTPNAVDIASKLSVPVLGLYGAKDDHITADHVAQMRASLAQGSSGSQIKVYPEAQHGFHADYRPSYNAAAAKDGWENCLSWFKKHGA